jgi:regulator of protease activity HflC (stomatin/prohibitin superfamily)
MLQKAKSDLKFWPQVILAADFIISYDLVIKICYFAEGDQQEQINQAQGEAQGLLSRAQARAKSLELLSAALENKVCRILALSL